MGSIREYINIIEAAMLQRYANVSTPLGGGRILKIDGDQVHVELDDGELKTFRYDEVKQAGQLRRSDDRPTPRSNFSPSQMRAGWNTPVLG